MNDNFVRDVLVIGNIKVDIIIKELNQADLKFYPENPRVYSALNSDGTSPSQDDIEEHMKALDHVRDLRDDIKRNGGLIEDIIVRDGDFVVLEGNSRLAAYRLLAEKDPVKWGTIKCKILPNDISEDLIFKLIGQYHIKGKKPWDAYEQASYLYRRQQQTHLPIEVIAEELGFQKAKANNMIEAVKMMMEHSERDNHRYSYYFEYVKDSNIKRYRETFEQMDDVFVEMVKKGDLKEAEDVRKLAKIAKVKDKQSKKLMKQIIEKNISVYDAYIQMDDDGKMDSSVQKLKRFKDYINTDTFEKNVKSSPEIYKNAVYEIKKIQSKLKRLLEKWES